MWGREIIHINLQTTGGPTWKPLPVIFTTIFALFGKAEPDLWLVVARAGAFAAVVMVFRLSFRLTRQIGSYFSADDRAASGRSAAGVAARRCWPGAIAAIGLALSGGYISSNALGYSEGLATAVILIALERHWTASPARRSRSASSAALDRPGDLAVLGPLRPVAVLEGSGRAQAGHRACSC